MPLPIRLALDIAGDELNLVQLVAGGPTAEPVTEPAGAPLLIRVDDGLALPLWSSLDGAVFAAREAAATTEGGVRPRPLRIAGDDLRAKEELLRDALELGAALVLHDPRPGAEGGLEPAGVDLVQRALNEILAERRGSACL